MIKYGKYREKMDRFFKPRVWWSFWIAGALFFSYMLVFNAILLLKNNYGLPGEIALQDAEIGKLFFFAINIPLTSFTCLFTAHMALALYKMDQLKKVKKNNLTL